MQGTTTEDDGLNCRNKRTCPVLSSDCCSRYGISFRSPGGNASAGAAAAIRRRTAAECLSGVTMADFLRSLRTRGGCQGGDGSKRSQRTGPGLRGAAAGGGTVLRFRTARQALNSRNTGGTWATEPEREPEHPFSALLLTPRTVFRTRRGAASQRRQDTMVQGLPRTRPPPGRHPAGGAQPAHRHHACPTSSLTRRHMFCTSTVTKPVLGR
jgi:hypothetical protein